MRKTLALAISLAFAQSALQAANLSEVTERALANNPEVRARMYQFMSSGEEYNAGRAAMRPRVDLQAFGGRENLESGGVDYGSFNHSGASLQLRQILFDGFGTYREIRRLGYNKASRYYELLASTDDTALESARAYLDVIRYRQLVALAQDNWRIHKETYDQIEQRVKAGVGRRVDLEQASGRLALAESNWITETSNLHDVSARYTRIVGEAPPVLAEAPDMTSKLPPPKAVVETAIRNNPVFLGAVAGLRAARAQIDVRQAANYPSLEFRASTSRENNRQGYNGTYKDSVAQIVLDYNLFRGGGDQARIRAAQMQYNAAEELRNKACRDVRQVTTIAWNDAQRLRDQVKLLEQHMLTTQKARDAYRQQFDIGQRTLLDLLDSENELFQARRSLNNAQIDVQLAQFRVLAATHEILPALKLASSASSAPDEQLGGAEASDLGPQCDLSAPNYQPLELPAARQSASVAAEQPQPSPVPSPMPASSQGSQCTIAAQEWAQAWSARDFGKYMGFYSSKFEPLTVADRKAWRALREARLNKTHIAVTLSKISTTVVSPDRCDVSFHQDYRSNNFNDTVDKTLSLARENGSWKIVKEVARPQKSGSN